MTRTAKAAQASAAARTQPAPNGLPLRLRKARQDSGLTLRELAQKSGLSASTISNLERGRVRPLEQIEQLAAALGVKAADLAGW